MSNTNYEDIIDLPHYHDPSRPFMAKSDRAAQFAPFKSLTVDCLYQATESSTDNDYQIIWTDD